MKRLIAILLLFFVLLAACKKEEEDKDFPREEEEQKGQTVLDISSMTLALDNDGNAKTFSIVSNGEWTITNNSSWCKTNKTYGKGNTVVNVMASPYDEYDDRNTNLTIKAGNKTKVITITQKKKDALLLTEENTLFDSLDNKLIDYPDLKQMLLELLLQGNVIEYVPGNLGIRMAAMSVPPVYQTDHQRNRKFLCGSRDQR